MDNKNHQNPKEVALRKDFYKANPLINARKAMNIIEMRIFAIGLQALKPRRSSKDKFYDTEFPRTFIPASKIVEIFDDNNYLHDLKKICDKMSDSRITINYENGGFKLLHIFQELEYKPEEGLYVQFDIKMKPYILDLFETKKYTKLNVEQIFPLVSSYAVRLLELLFQFQKNDQKTISLTINIDDLRIALKVPENAYAGRVDNFRAYVIDEPLAEINEKTDYKIDYAVLKTGRRVTGFKFSMDISKILESNDLPLPETVKEVEKVETIDKVEEVETDEAVDMIDEFGKIGEDEAREEMITSITAHGVRESEARKLLDMCRDIEDCANRLHYAEVELDNQWGRVKNVAGFVITAIKENWYQRSLNQFRRDQQRVGYRDPID